MLWMNATARARLSNAERAQDAGREVGRDLSIDHGLDIPVLVSLIVALWLAEPPRLLDNRQSVAL